MKTIKNYDQFVNEGILDKTKEILNKIIEFVSSDGTNVLRKVNKTDDKSEKEKLLDEYIESLAKEYIDIIKKDEVNSWFYLLQLMIEINKFNKIYRQIAGKKHKRDKFKSEYLGGAYFAWPEVLKITDKDKLKEIHKEELENLEKIQKNKLESLKKEQEEIQNLLNEL